MRAISDARMEDFEGLALESVKQLRAFYTYSGSDARYFQKARLATGAIGAYARIRASETNRMAVEMQVERLTATALPPSKKEA